MHVDLFEQARFLATRDARRPKQVNLRRAVSAAYYAVFHFLVDAACRMQLGNQHQQAGFRHALGRAFTHTALKSACSGFGGGNLKKDICKGLPLTNGVYVIPKPIQNLAAAFVELQRRRHLADYDRTENFRRSNVMLLIEQAMNHVADFEQLPPSDDRAFFLSCLWAYKELVNR